MDRRSEDSLLRVKGLTRPGLAPVTLDLAAGECLAVRGASGAGKSLLLRAIADLDPNEGSVSLGGERRESMSGPEWRGQVGYLAAEPSWWRERAGDHFSAGAQTAAWLAALLLPEEIVEQPVARLSTGERQRLALIRALARGPRVLLLDEPTAALDADATQAVEDLMAAWLGDGNAALWASHDLEQLGRLARRCLTLEQGVAREERL